MNKTMKKMLSLAVIFLLCAIPLSFIHGSDTDAVADQGSILLDRGNGDTDWIAIEAGAGDSYDDVLRKAFTKIGVEYSASGTTITVDGTASSTIGGTQSGGSMTSSGTTGVQVVSTWHFFSWNEIESEWHEEPYSPDSVYDGGNIAIAFYPTNTLPVENPDNRSSWTMVRGDSESTGGQNAETSEKGAASVKWAETKGKNNYVCSTLLSADNYVYIIFGGGYSESDPDPEMVCYDRLTGLKVWSYTYEKGAGYETATPLIAGEYIFIPATNGHIYKIPRISGPGSDDKDVTSVIVPYKTDVKLDGRQYSTASSSLVFDSGTIYCGASNGMVYCFDMDLRLVWSYQMNGSVYYTSPTVSDGYVMMGALNGSAYIMNQMDGRLIVSESVYAESDKGKINGQVSNIVKIDGVLMMTYSDGQGMGTSTGGVALYNFDGTSLVLIKKVDTIGVVGSYMTPVTADEFKGVYVCGTKEGLCKISVNGELTLLNSSIVPIKAPLTLVNNEHIYAVSYNAGGPIYKMDLNGRILGEIIPPAEASNYAMTPVVVINDWIYTGNDGGAYSVYGIMEPQAVSTGDDMVWLWALVIVLILLLLIPYLYLRFIRHDAHPYASIRRLFSKKMGTKDDGLSHTKRSKRRLSGVLIFGTIMAFFVFLMCIACGPSGNLSLGDAFGALISSIEKGGKNLVFNELVVYESRLPRAMAAFAVGVGLSVAGAMYQAVIRNPLVDPYIMGVSAGAGTAAVATIAFNFTFFGLFAPNSIYLTAIAAIIGGIVAFLATMLIAEKSGGISINYVLAGVVIGLAFSAAQTLMISMSGTKVHDSLTWLFGSFASVSWNNVWMIVIPSLALSFLPLLWAKEFNLVLLGEDQAKQMGLDVRKFNRTMLILASILTAVCVAFVGIIGFVGLVIPHLCRMILGGDHRLVLPASIVLGGSLMMIADFAAKMLMIPTELPVGAITTIIGVPVFAYLLIRKGRMYDG